MERFGLPSRRAISARSILTFVLVVVVTALLWVIIGGQAAHAWGDTDASWGGESIIYGDHGFNQSAIYKDTTGTIPSGATMYATPVLPGAGTGSKKVNIIYFTSGVDPPKATTAKYVEFEVSANNQLSHPANKRDITISVKTDNDEFSSCSVGGVGWFICPISVFLANAMDGVFNILSGMIKVQPSVLGDPNNSMYVAWNVMRNIANVAFVIVFLIIIYSQLTNLGVSNYGIKKLIPRLIIAAILVNASFIVAALAIDISNVLGYSVQNVFNTIREDLFHITTDNFTGVNNSPWTVVTNVILAGGGIIGGTYFVATGGLYLLIPLLLGLIVAVIVVLVILAARQAIIVILVIIAPIAFVANLLPNTEKWFDKWKDLFFTMLIFFPAFSLVFGGSQLAGQLIIQNAGDNIITVLFGMAVQIAPLVITPLILKLSGGLLGKIAQIANNPSKGLLDRNKKWANDKAEMHRQGNMEKKNARWWLNPGKRIAQAADTGARKTKYRTDLSKLRADNKFYGTNEKYKKLHEDMQEAELQKQAIENRHTAHAQGLMSTRNSKLNIAAVELDNAKTSSERATARTAEMISGYRAGTYDTAGNEHLANLQRTMAENVIETAAWKQGEQNNQYAQQRSISDRMRVDNRLLNIAQGYGNEDQQTVGRERAQAAALATLNKLNKDARDNTITLMETEAVEAKKSVSDYAIQNIFANANSADQTIRDSVTRSRLEAALEIAAADGQVTVFDDSRASMHIDQTLVDAVVARHVTDMKTKGGFHVQKNLRLSLQRYIEDFNAGSTEHGTTLEEVTRTFESDQKLARLSTLGNTTSTNLAGMKYGAFERLSNDIRNNNLLDAFKVGPDGSLSESDTETVTKIFESLREGLSDPSTRASMTDRLAFARNMEEAVRAKFFPDAEPLKLPNEERARVGGGQRPASMDQNFPLPTEPVDPTASSPSENQDDNN